jgi:hypothetical protein
VKVSRPGLEIRTRAGYYAAKPEQAAKPSTRPAPTAIDRALSNGLPTGDIPLALSVNAVPVAGRKDPAVAVVAGLSAVTRRAFRPDEAVSAVVRVSQIGAKRLGVVTIAAIIQDRDGAEVSREIRELSLELFATNRIVEHRATLPLNRLQPGEYLLTFEARSGSQIEQRRARLTVIGL